MEGVFRADIRDESSLTSSQLNIVIPMDTGINVDPTIVMIDSTFTDTTVSALVVEPTGDNIVTQIEPVHSVTTTSTDYANKRPRRAAAVVALQRVQEVLKWERCKESSSMFKDAAVQINAEFDRVSRGENSVKKIPVFVVASEIVTSEMHGSGTVSSSEVVTIDPSGINPVVISADSDDEATALHSDVEDREDIDNDDDDDNGSLASFVVDDDYCSDASGLARNATDVDNDSGSEPQCESDSEYDSEQDDSDFDDTMICNDDSDAEIESIEEVDEGTEDKDFILDDTQDMMVCYTDAQGTNIDDLAGDDKCTVDVRTGVDDCENGSDMN